MVGPWCWSSPCGCDGAVRFHCVKKFLTRKSLALRISSRCAEARSRLCVERFDGALFEAVALRGLWGICAGP